MLPLPPVLLLSLFLKPWTIILALFLEVSVRVAQAGVQEVWMCGLFQVTLSALYTQASPVGCFLRMLFRMYGDKLYGPVPVPAGVPGPGPGPGHGTAHGPRHGPGHGHGRGCMQTRLKNNKIFHIVFWHWVQNKQTGQANKAMSPFDVSVSGSVEASVLSVSIPP